MRVLVATRDSQGTRDDDFDWCVDGELVWIDEPCDRDRRGDPRSCGCGRSFAGMASRRSTTTAIVQDLPHMDRAVLMETLRQSLMDQSWPVTWAEGLVEDLTLRASAWPEGTVLERHLDLVRCRFDPSDGTLQPRFDAPLR